MTSGRPRLRWAAQGLDGAGTIDPHVRFAPRLGAASD